MTSRGSLRAVSRSRMSSSRRNWSDPASAVQRGADGDPAEYARDVVGGDGLDERRREPDRVAVGGPSAMLFIDSKNCVAWTIE